MREKILYVIVLLAVLFAGISGTLYFTKDNNKQIVSKQDITIKETNSLNKSIKKVYNAVVIVESYTGQTQTATGSGFVYKTDKKYGYILTNYHVVQNAGSLKVLNMKGEEAEATYLGGDSYADIAVVRVDKDFVLGVAEIGDSSKSVLGDTVFTVGTPVNSEYKGTVTKGIVSGEARTITVSDSIKGSYMMEVIQTDASINPGNSGGPLLNINGEVIGITSMKLVTAEIEGMGFAIPIEIAMASVPNLEKGEKIKRPYIGVSLSDITTAGFFGQFTQNIDKNLKNGAIVVQVESGSVADDAGLEANDVIVKVDGKEIKNTAHFKYVLYKYEVGDTVKFTVNRNGKEKELTLKLSKSQGA